MASSSSSPTSAASAEDPFRSSADNMADLPKEPATAHTRTHSKSSGSATQQGVDHAVSPGQLPPLTLPIVPSQQQQQQQQQQRDTGGFTESKRLLDQVTALLRTHDEHQQQHRTILTDTDPLHQALGLNANAAGAASAAAAAAAAASASSASAPGAKPQRPFSPIPTHLQDALSRSRPVSNEHDPFQQAQQHSSQSPHPLRDSDPSITAALDDRLGQLAEEQQRHERGKQHQHQHQQRPSVGFQPRNPPPPIPGPSATGGVPASDLANKLQSLAAVAPNRVSSPISPSNPSARSLSTRNTRSTQDSASAESAGLPAHVPGGTNTVGSSDPTEVATGIVGADYGPFPSHIRQGSYSTSAMNNVGPNPGAGSVPPLAMIATGMMPKNMRSTPSPQQAQLQRELSERKQAASPTGAVSVAASVAPTLASHGPYAVQMRPPSAMHGNQGMGGYGIAQPGQSSSIGHAAGLASVRSESIIHGGAATQPLLGRAGPGASMSGIVASFPPGPPTVSGSHYGPGRYPLSPSVSGNLHSYRNSTPFSMARPGAVNTPGVGGIGGLGGPLAVDNLLWNEKEKDVDDYLHNPDPNDDRDIHGCGTVSPRGIFNVATLALVVAGCLALFAGYPLIAHFTREAYKTAGATNLGGTNGTGQVPDLKIFQIIDPETPQDAYTFTSLVEDQTQYQLVFSDEFNQEGRTFWPGDDPFWEAVDIWYGATHDYQWYSPEAINTTNGALQITMEALPNHNLNFRSGMLQSWNKFCYQGGYIEFSAILPGGPTTKGYWPAAWMMGNLGRPGYLGSTDGMWPYSYSSCDTGILPSQLYLNGTGPLDTISNFSTFSQKDPPQLSLLPGMRLPVCTCAGEDHPGPNVNTARSSPELDVFEVTQQGRHSYASQTYQIAPFDSAQQWKNSTLPGGNAVLYGSEEQNHINNYKGTPYQESVSGYAQVPDDGFMDTGQRFVKYGVEYFPDWDESGQGTITWYIDGMATWTARGSTLDPAPSMDVGRRLFPVEPMSIIMNLGISSGFQQINWNPLTGVNFPAVMLFDYVRLYQQPNQQKLSCDPPDHPTSNYINSHLDIYYNPNLTVYPREKYGWPKNKLTGC
ncbi:beta-glucan synthesis-associated protein [Tilletia horrida]|nr:beta-glucan synthesis-associated protein [Tilletia horrida]